MTLLALGNDELAPGPIVIQGDHSYYDVTIASWSLHTV
jgi:hypothetical protein